MNMARTWGGALALAAALLCAAGANAQGIDLAVSVGGFHTDNVRRESVDEESQTVGELGLRLGIERDTGRLNSHVSANLAYRNYFDDAYDEDLRGGVDATVTYWFAPERFSWVIQDNLGQAFIDPRNVDTPDNQQNANFFSTGPDLRLPIGDRTSVLLSGRWSQASYEEFDADNQRFTGTLGLERRLSERSSLSVNATAERVEYDNEVLNSNYDRQSGYVALQSEGARTTLAVQAGYTALHDFGDTTDGPLLDVRLTRQMSPRTTLTLNAGTALTDSAEAMRRDQRIVGVEIEGGLSIASTDPFQSDYASLGWALEGTRTSANLDVNWRTEDHEREAALNRDSIGATARLTRHIGPRLSAGLYGGWTKQDFEDSDVEFDEWNVGVDLNWELSAQFGVTVRGDRFEGSGDTALGVDQRDYTENRVTLTFTYTPRR